jgi:hypothetical protein
MDFDQQIELEHLLFVDRQCRKCLRTMSLLDNFYKTRKDRGNNVSAYSYECKQCTIKRISKNRKKYSKRFGNDYPDW